MGFIVVALALLLLVLIVVGIARSRNNGKEHFEDSTKNGAVPSSVYNNRLYVIKVFDTMFGRNPTHTELDLYSGAATEKDILDSIVKDYQNLSNQPVETIKIDGFTAEDDTFKEAEMAVAEKESRAVTASSAARAPVKKTQKPDVQDLKAKLRALRLAVDEAIDMAYGLDSGVTA